MSATYEQTSGDMQRYKDMVIDAICGIGMPSMLIATECEKVGMAEFSGNQWNPSWLWRRDRLAPLSVSQLQELYDGLYEARKDAQAPTDPADDVPSSIIIQ